MKSVSKKKPFVVRKTREYFYVEFTSSKGNKFEVGYPKSAGYKESTLAAELAKHESKKPSYVDDEFKYIHCAPTGPSTISRAAIDIGIVGAFTWKDKDPFYYDYQIMFANYTGGGFTFKDESGDTYSCATIRDGNHTINYNSDHPTLVGVKLD